jgi:hypothetical protein
MAIDFTAHPDDEAIEQQFTEATRLEAEGRNSYLDSTYVRGVAAALSWVLGESDDKPIPTDVDV